MLDPQGWIAGDQIQVLPTPSKRSSCRSWFGWSNTLAQRHWSLKTWSPIYSFSLKQFHWTITEASLKHPSFWTQIYGSLNLSCTMYFVPKRQRFSTRFPPRHLPFQTFSFTNSFSICWTIPSTSISASTLDGLMHIGLNLFLLWGPHCEKRCTMSLKSWD